MKKSVQTEDSKEDVGQEDDPEVAHNSDLTNLTERGRGQLEHEKQRSFESKTSQDWVPRLI